MIIIAEKINASRKNIEKAISIRDSDFISELVIAQDRAGADYLDINVGGGSGEESAAKESIRWLVETVKTSTNKPLVIDSDNPEVIEAGLHAYGEGKVMLNSVTAEQDRLKKVGEMASETNADLIALSMGSEGIPDNVKQRLEACDIIMNTLTKLGIKPEKIYFDPLVLPVSVDAKQGKITFETIRAIKSKFPGAKTVVGLSNISYGLPGRKQVNRVFLMMAIEAGIDAAIMDPMDNKLMSGIKIATLLGGSETTARPYIRAFRNGRIIN